MSKILKDAYQLLGISGLSTTSCHPQTIRLSERSAKFKQMPCTFVDDTGSDWDQCFSICYLLTFAYIEVLEASTD